MHTREITKTVYKISDFLAWQKAQLLILSPYFQRRSVWSLGAKSYLLDTVVRGLPIPDNFLTRAEDRPYKARTQARGCRWSTKAENTSFLYSAAITSELQRRPGFISDTKSPQQGFSRQRLQ